MEVFSSRALVEKIDSAESWKGKECDLKEAHLKDSAWSSEKRHRWATGVAVMSKTHQEGWTEASWRMRYRSEIQEGSKTREFCS